MVPIILKAKEPKKPRKLTAFEQVEIWRARRRMHVTNRYLKRERAEQIKWETKLQRYEKSGEKDPIVVGTAREMATKHMQNAERLRGFVKEQLEIIEMLGPNGR